MNSGPNSYYKSNKISPFRVTHFPYLRCKFRILPSTWLDRVYVFITVVSGRSCQSGLKSYKDPPPSCFITSPHVLSPYLQSVHASFFYLSSHTTSHVTFVTPRYATRLIVLSYFAHCITIDVDLNHAQEGPTRFYPAPHTGHELMALFPPAPPAPFDGNMGSTNCFRREERAFFAQGHGDPSRVRVDVDPSTQMPERRTEKGKRRDSSSGRPYLPSPPHAYNNNMSPGYPVHPETRSSRGPPPPPPASFQSTTHSQSPPNPHPYSPLAPPPPGSPPGGKVEQDGDDEGWRRPMAHSERRRAGKHTKRVIVRSWSIDCNMNNRNVDNNDQLYTWFLCYGTRSSRLTIMIGSRFSPARSISVPEFIVSCTRALTVNH